MTCLTLLGLKITFTNRYMDESQTISIFLWWRNDRTTSIAEVAVGFACPIRTCYNTDSELECRCYKNQNKITYGMRALRLAPLWNKGFPVTPELLQSGPTHLNALRMASMRRTEASSIVLTDDTYCPLLIDLLPNHSLNAECLLILWLLSRKRLRWTLLTVALIWVCFGGMKS